MAEITKIYEYRHRNVNGDVAYVNGVYRDEYYGTIFFASSLGPFALAHAVSNSKKLEKISSRGLLKSESEAFDFFILFNQLIGSCRFIWSTLDELYIPTYFANEPKFLVKMSQSNRWQDPFQNAVISREITPDIFHYFELDVNIFLNNFDKWKESDDDLNEINRTGFEQLLFSTPHGDAHDTYLDFYWLSGATETQYLRGKEDDFEFIAMRNKSTQELYLLVFFDKK